MNWTKVNSDDPSTLPPLEQVVFVCYRSGYNGAPVVQLGGRGDFGEEGWMWGMLDTAYFVKDWEPKLYGFEANDDYDVTHWAPIQWPEDK